MDPELEAIRQARRAELQLQQHSSEPLAAVLEPAARERLSRVRIVRPERAAQVEDHLARLAALGQLRQKVSEADVKQLLASLARGPEKKIVYERKDSDWNE